MIGLTMWPESLRHPVSVVPGQPLPRLDQQLLVQVQADVAPAGHDSRGENGGMPAQPNRAVQNDLARFQFQQVE